MNSNRWAIVGTVLIAMLALAVTIHLGRNQSAGPPAIANTGATDPGSSVPTSRAITLPGPVREPAVAGLFYPADATALGGMIDGFLAQAPGEPVGNVRGLISPHAGYRFSGAVAAYAYRQLVGRSFRTVIVMAPSHYALLQGGFIPAVGQYRTPLGLIPVSPKAGELAKRPPFSSDMPCEVQRPQWAAESPKAATATGADNPDTWEHSLEVQLPFLQKTLKDFAIIPIVFGRVDPAAAAKVLGDFVDDETLVVASSDLSHYRPYDAAKAQDGTTVRAICDGNPAALGPEDACGFLPIVTLMELARQKGWQAKLLDYRNSGDTAGDKSAVVGYAAVAFVAPAPATASAPSFTREDRRFLLDLAARTVEAAANHGQVPEVDPKTLSGKLTAPGACFVTLTEKGELRGCIGSLIPVAPLYRSVIDNARNAATQDPRFPAVQPGELGQIEIEISVLTIPQPLEFSSPEDLAAKLRPRRDGVILDFGSARSTFLPQVWEQFAAPEEFLNHLARKAGMPADAWRSPGVKVLTYQVEAFKQSEE